jgi:CRP-like cAMP-binding protein
MSEPERRADASAAEVVSQREALLAFLAEQRVFRGLEPDGLQALAAAARSVQRDPGEFLLRQGEPAAEFFVLRSGRLRLSQISAEGHQVVIRFVGPGDGVGIIAVLGGIPYPLSAEAVEPVEALSWSGEGYAELMERHPVLALEALGLIAGRFKGAMDQLRELSTQRVERRVAHALLRLAGQMGRRLADGSIELDLPLSQQDLAEMTGTTVFTVSRTLSSWESRGLVQTGRKRVVLRQPHDLVAIAEDLPDGA